MRRVASIAAFALILLAVVGPSPAGTAGPEASVFGWGLDSIGQLGDGAGPDKLLPVHVKDQAGTGALVGTTAVAAGQNFSLALTVGGNVWAWGAGSVNGQLGDGSLADRSLPVHVKDSAGTGILSGVTAIAAGDRHSLALAADGTVWAWGSNLFDQLGDNGVSGTKSTLPVQVKDAAGTGVLSDVIAVAAGANHSLALTSDGKVWAWGANALGQAGDGVGSGTRALPVRVKDRFGISDLTDINGDRGRRRSQPCAVVERKGVGVGGQQPWPGR